MTVVKDRLKKVVCPEQKAVFETDTPAPEGYYVNTHEHQQIRNRGGLVPKIINTIRENRFCFLAAVGPDYIISCAIVNLKWMSHAFVSIYIPKQNINIHSTSIGGLIRFPRTPDLGTIKYSHPLLSIEMKSFGSERRKEVRFRTRHGSGGFSIIEDYKPVAATRRDDDASFVFTQKLAGSQSTANLVLNGNAMRFPDASAVIDWSSGVYPKVMGWQWAASAWRENGFSAGFNLADGDRKTNYLWCKYGSYNLPMVNFEYDLNDIMKPWRIRSEDGSVDLIFTPECKHVEKKDFMVVATDFNQCVGRFNGTIRLSEKQSEECVARDFPIVNRLGFCESNKSKLSLK